MNAKSTICKQHFYALIFKSSPILRSLVTLVFLCSLLFSTAMSQSYKEIDAKAAGLQVVAPAIVLSPGEATVLSVETGSPASPLTKTIGFVLELELLDGVQTPAMSDINFSNSWLVDPLTSQIAMYFDAATRILHIEASGFPPTTGNGLLFELSLTSLQNNLPANAMVVDGGGIIMVEDIGFKMTPQGDISASTSPVPYPNPCQGNLNFDWNGNPPSRLLFVDSRGQIAKVVQKESVSRNRVDVSGLSSDMYQVIASFSDHSTHHFSVLKQ